MSEALPQIVEGSDPIALGTLHVPAKACKVLLGNEGRPLIRDKEQGPGARGPGPLTPPQPDTLQEKVFLGLLRLHPQ